MTGPSPQCMWGAYFVTHEGRRVDMPCRKVAGHGGNHVSPEGDHQWNTAWEHEPDDADEKAGSSKEEQ